MNDEQNVHTEHVTFGDVKDEVEPPARTSKWTVTLELSNGGCVNVNVDGRWTWLDAMEEAAVQLRQLLGPQPSGGTIVGVVAVRS